MWYQGRMSGIYTELKRRNVFRVVIAYTLVAWILLQIADVLFPALSLPDWTVRLVAGLLILGFPLAVFFAWAYELTPEGLKRERDVDRDESIAHQTGRKLNFMVIAILAVAVALFALDKFVWNADQPAAAATEDDRSIAVLPFVNMSDDKANEYFSDGISEELLNLLAQIPELRVIGRTSSFQFKNRNEDLRKIGTQLGVTNILEGSVRKAGNTVRITAQLISADDGAHLWSQSYDRNLDDVFRIQDEIATAVVDALRLELLGSPVTTRGVPATTAVYDAYLKGLFHYRKLGREDLETALRYFEDALALDPNLAEAWEKKGSVYMNQTLGGSLPLEEGLDKTRDALARAIKLDPNLPDSNYLNGFLQTVFEWNWDDGMASLEKTLAIEPNHSGALSNLALLYVALNRIDEAIELSERSIRADPLRIASQHNHGYVYYKSGMIDDAVREFRDTLDFAPDMIRGHYRYALALLANGEPDAALAEAGKEVGKQWRLAGLAIIHGAMGDIEASDAALTELTAQFADDVPYSIAKAHAVRGEVDQAFEWFDIAYEIHDPLLPWMRSDPQLDNVRDDPRFNAMLDRLNLPQ
jgi:TolB-like protein/Tfp pilus assembly protein PilF